MKERDEGVTAQGAFDPAKHDLQSPVQCSTVLHEKPAAKSVEGELAFRTLAELASEGVIIGDILGTNIYANRKAADITGYSITELLQSGVRDPAFTDHAQCRERQYRRTHGELPVPVCWETIIRRKDGRQIRIEVTGLRVFWQGRIRWMMIFRDISDHREWQHQVAEREQKLREVKCALKALLDVRELEKRELQDEIVSQLEELVLPYLRSLKASTLDAEQRAWVGLLQSNLLDTISRISSDSRNPLRGLSSVEVRIINLIIRGKTTKEMANLLQLSTKTIEFHRETIRKKLNIRDRKVHLRSHLLALLGGNFSLPNQ